MQRDINETYLAIRSWLLIALFFFAAAMAISERRASLETPPVKEIAR